MSWKETVQDILDKEKNKIVTINLEKETVDYSDQIKKHENPKIIGGDEEIVRAYLVNRLANQLDYKPEDIEIEKRYEISLGRKTKEHKAENDVILRDNKGNAFYLIETKSPKEFEGGKKTIIGQLFGIAREEARKCEVKYLCYYSLDEIDGGVKDKAIIIDFDKFKEYDDWVDAGEPSVGNELSPGYDKPKKQPFIKGDHDHDLITRINRDEISSLSSNLHNVLWGGGGTSDTEIFYSLVNIILAKIQDESEKEEDQEYDFQIYAYGDNIENAEKVFDRINNLYKRALKEKLNITNKLELQEARVIDRNKFPLNKLVYTVQSLEKYSFIEGRSSLDGRDILGDFFENITRDGFKQTKGQFFTPTPIIRFMLYALKLDELALDKLNTELELPFIIDPSVGSGSFLIEAMKVVTKEIKYKQKSKVKTSYQVKERFDDFFMPDHKENRWAEKFLYGTDINFDLGTASKVNMILHGDGSSNIFVKDGLLPFKFYTKDKTTSLVEQDRNENGEYPVMGSNGIVGYHDEYLIEGPSIIVGRKGSAGEVTYVEKNSFPIDTTFYVKLKDNTYRLKFLFYLLRVAKLSRLALFKGVPGLNRYDAYEVLIPVVPKDVQDTLLKIVEPLEKQVLKLQEKLRQPLDVINTVFAKEFKYAPSLWREFGKGMTAGTQKSNVKSLSTFTTPSSEIHRSNIIRFSSRYHNPLTQQLSDILRNLPHRKVSSVIKCIKKGVQPNYDPYGGLRVIKIANMKNGYLDFSEPEFTTEEFYQNNKEQAGVELDDILICCTGKVSLGKVDIYEEEEPAILSVDSYIIKVDEQKVDRLFFVYFFRSILGAFQIERDFTGTTNQIHLYDDQILEFDLPDLQISEQQTIADKIKKELDAQKEIQKQIDDKQSEIATMIEAAIKTKQPL